VPVLPCSTASFCGEGLSKAAMVELRGLEPLTFLLRRHRVDLTRREHRVIGVPGAASAVPWLHHGGTHRDTINADFQSFHDCLARQ
jgi:hypothetical protein